MSRAKQENGSKSPRYRYPLGVQLALPPGYRLDRRFQDTLALLQRRGVTHLELNIAEPESVDPADVTEHLASFGLSVTCFASGLTARTERLSLSHPDAEERGRAVRRALEMIDYAARFPAGLIIGFLKGPAGPDREEAARRLAASLESLAPRAERRSVPVLLEATNRYESATANSLAEAADLVRPFGGTFMQILPDTFHMNIEERDMLAALSEQAPYYRSVHLSDNNRLLPGLGAIDFARVIGHLERIGFRGRLALEGNVRRDLVEDLGAALDCLAPLLEPPDHPS